MGRPHGLDGSFVVEEASETPGRLGEGATVYVGGEPATVVAAKRSGGRIVVRLDRSVGRGVRLEVRRAELPSPEPDSYYVFELIGVPVEEEGGRLLGAVAEVEPGIANDAVVLDTGLRLPLVEACVKEVDLEKRRIVVAVGFADPG